MVGGGQGAFIGAVHRTAALLDGVFALTAGALSSTPDRARASGAAIGLADDRNYPDWRTMLDAERRRDPGQRIDAVAIVTPNDTHFEIARAFAQAGFHVLCDKPLVHTSAQATELIRVVRNTGVIFAVSYNYSGYPLVRQARELIAAGAIGRIRRVCVEYHQGWLATRLEASGQKQAAWRTDPARSGAAGALGDIGSHAEQLVACVTGLELESLCVDQSTFVPGRQVDDDAAMLLRFVGGARGTLTASQVCVGAENDLRLRVWGETGGIEWRQEQPNELRVAKLGEPECLLRRGNDYLGPAARSATRLPPGHPEAFFEAFANIYRGFGAAIHAGASGLEAAAQHDFPGVLDGARGVHFIEKALESARSDARWTAARFIPPA
ncbi:MAG: Gfo/Idh/MocA family oxidoreductase [Phycisphaerales bacterium]|nr:Gfo/Idh/MocA family oxidoreductase [Phycisphaerales bacterium]